MMRNRTGIFGVAPGEETAQLPLPNNSGRVEVCLLFVNVFIGNIMKDEITVIMSTTHRNGLPTNESTKWSLPGNNHRKIVTQMSKQTPRKLKRCFH